MSSAAQLDESTEWAARSHVNLGRLFYGQVAVMFHTVLMFLDIIHRPAFI
jgi:hypothetical protein